MQRWVRLSGPILSVLLVESLGAEAARWRDPSPHTVRFVTVDDGVRLEVLEWGGSGRPVVLLAGGGNTAHVFDDFAPKLATHYRVYGITRRGCGASGFAESPNPVDRLRDDLLSALDVLGLDHPVLAGHSIAGAEMSAIARSQPLRIAGLVYLDAAYPYAFDDGLVSVENSLAWISAAKAAKAPVEAHLLAEGGHGFGLHLPASNPGSRWPDLFALWMRRHGG